ncbi:O-antigen ligase family protein [Sphingomonas sp. 22L2VL55-3]
MAIGIAAASTWAADQQKAALWRLPVAGGAAIWFLLMIIASGSRTGLVLGFLSLVISIIIARPALTALLSPVPPRLRWAIVIVGVATIIALAVVSFTSGRAVSFHRLLTLSTGEDMRSRALPIVLDMVRTYMPLGSGLGSFDPLFRMYEPDALLKLTYFNHAHNDYLEVALQSGIFGIALIILIIGWGIYAGIKAWRSHPARPSQLAARFATVAMLLIAIASGVDYPARTPIIMALIAIVAILANPTSRPTDGSSALRSKGIAYSAPSQTDPHHACVKSLSPLSSC